MPSKEITTACRVAAKSGRLVIACLKFKLRPGPIRKTAIDSQTLGPRLSPIRLATYRARGSENENETSTCGAYTA